MKVFSHKLYKVLWVTLYLDESASCPCNHAFQHQKSGCFLDPRICSFISSCICRNIFANIPALRKWWQVFYRLVKFFQRNAKIWETGKNRRGYLWYSFQGICCSWEGVQSLVKWPPKPSVTLNGFQALRLSLHLQASLCHSVCTPLFETLLAFLIFCLTFLWLNQQI